MQDLEVFIDRAAGCTWVNIIGEVLWEYSTIVGLAGYYSLNKAVNNSGNFIREALRFVSTDLLRSWY
jgi:hypothetical protein